MSTSLIIATYFTVWWITLFAVLPFWVKTPENPDALHDAGAPEKPHLLKKFLVNTLVAAIVTAIIVMVANSYLPPPRNLV